VHREVEAVLVPLGGVGKVAGVRAIGDDEELQELVERVLAVEALLTVTVDLIEGLTNGDAAPFELHLHQGQAIDQNGHIVAIGLAAALLKLPDDLAGVAQHVLLIEQVDVLDVAVIKDEVVNVVIVDLAGLFQDVFARPIEVGLDETRPFGFGKLDVVEGLELRADVGEQFGWSVQLTLEDVAEVLQILNQFPLQRIFALVGLCELPFLLVSIKDDKAVGLGDGFGFGHGVLNCLQNL
jgi:hypothetical protein